MKTSDWMWVPVHEYFHYVYVPLGWVAATIEVHDKTYEGDAMCTVVMSPRCNVPNKLGVFIGLDDAKSAVVRSIKAGSVLLPC